MINKNFFIVIFFNLFFASSLFAGDRFFVCNGIFSDLKELQLKINVQKKIVDLNFNQLWKYKHGKTDYENIKIVNLNDFFKFINFEDDKNFIYFDVSVYPYATKKINQDNSLPEKLSNNEKNKIYTWMKYFNEIEKNSPNDKGFYINIVRLKFDRNFHKFYVKKNYNNHYSKTQRPFAIWVDYIVSLENKNSPTDAFLTCNEKKKNLI